MKKISFLVALCISTVFFSRCKEEVTECDIEGLACTQIFTTKQVSVKNTEGLVVDLDSVVVKKSGDNSVLFSEVITDNSEGIYKLISDSEKENIVKEGTDVTFYGYISGIEKVKEDFKVGHDCCHVVYISGTSDIVISE